MRPWTATLMLVVAAGWVGRENERPRPASAIDRDDAPQARDARQAAEGALLPQQADRGADHDTD